MEGKCYQNCLIHLTAKHLAYSKSLLCVYSPKSKDISLSDEGKGSHGISYWIRVRVGEGKGSGGQRRLFLHCLLSSHGSPWSSEKVEGYVGRGAMLALPRCLSCSCLQPPVQIQL